MMTDETRAAFLAQVFGAAEDLSTDAQASAVFEIVKRDGRTLADSATWQAACDWLTANYVQAEGNSDRIRRVVHEGIRLMVEADSYL
ncbi:hypothetical protein [Streptomyces uncialis]|uniref:Uncharacterized protein n=1 Tax=Streptomyces uncialis TaxID=1048205 RepID=A0A1Q4UY30_9ACTN|nr:hypothetical protein [Streptomyces uncialis]OKH90456.1 hypothetical protein AB852_35400 [Streptomyces uncialis]